MVAMVSSRCHAILQEEGNGMQRRTNTAIGVHEYMNCWVETWLGHLGYILSRSNLLYKNIWSELRVLDMARGSSRISQWGGAKLGTSIVGTKNVATG